MLSKQFVTAGKAIFTVTNPKGDHYTYRVRHKEANNGYPEAWFVELLTGPDNTEDYEYMSMLVAETGRLRLTKGSKLTAESLPFRVAEWGLKMIWAGSELPEGYAINHEGYCGRCGALLTVNASVESGFGPECIKKVMGCRPARARVEDRSEEAELTANAI